VAKSDVRRLTPAAAIGITEAVTAYLATLAGPEQAGTRRAYRSTLRALAEQFTAASDAEDNTTGEAKPFAVAELDDEANIAAVTDWFTTRWGHRAPATFNRNLDALRSVVGYWTDQGWITADPTKRIRRRGRTRDRARALSRADIEALFELEDLGLRERVLWRLLYESAARAPKSWPSTSKTWICATLRSAEVVTPRDMITRLTWENLPLDQIDAPRAARKLNSSADDYLRLLGHGMDPDHQE
jgi:hypothetical protein